MDLKEVQINWMRDILNRILHINNDPNYSEEDRRIAINWFIKQALKVDRE
jgi:hypothetical protein